MKNDIVKREKLRLRRMANSTVSSGILLDVGFAQCANPFLKADRIIGVDPNMVEKPPNYDEVFAGTIADYICAHGAGSVDSLVVGELLEHLEDPLGFLRECHNVLAIGGKLVLSTPNPNSLIERLLTITLSRKYFYTRQHVFIFPQRWLIRIIELVGFTNVRLRSGGFPVPFYGLIPFPRPWCYQSIVIASKSNAHPL